MTTDLNKKILIAPELISSAVGLFFQEKGFELCVEAVEGEHYLFAIDAACPELENIPRLQLAKTILPKLAENVRGFIDLQFFKHDDGKKLLTSHFNEAQELDLIERYSETLKQFIILRCKITSTWDSSSIQLSSTLISQISTLMS